jgi:hypothetical protein
MKTKLSSKILSLALTAVLLLSLTPFAVATAYAAGIITLSVGSDTDKDATQDQTGTGWSWDASSNTLTLNGDITGDTGSGFTVAGNTTYSVSAEGALLETASNTLHTFPSGKTDSYTVESGITKIGNKAFDNTQLTALTILAAVTDIGTEALQGALKTIIFEGSTPPTGLAANAFALYVSPDFIIVPSGAGSDYKTALSSMADVDTKVVEKGNDNVNVANETELKEALAKPYPTTITVTADFSITASATMNADHILSIPSGKTVTATVNSAIRIGAQTLTLNGDGTFVSAMATGHALSGNADAGTLNLELESNLHCVILRAAMRSRRMAALFLQMK